MMQTLDDSVWWLIAQRFADFLRAAMRRKLARWRSALEHYRRYRRSLATHRELCRLSDHMLRDLGLHRRELASVAAQACGRVERTRSVIRTAERL